MNSQQQKDQRKQKSRNNLINLLYLILISKRFQKYFKLVLLLIFCVIELVDLSFKIRWFSELQSDVIVFFIIVIMLIIMIPLISYNIINPFLVEALFCCLLGCLFESFLIDQQRIFRLCAFFIFSQRTLNDIQKLNGNKFALFILVLYPALRYSIENIFKISLVIQNILLLLVNSLFSIDFYSKNNKTEQKKGMTTLQNPFKESNLSLNNQTNQSNFIQNGQEINAIFSDPLNLNQIKHDQSSINQIFNYMNNNHISILNDEDLPRFNSFDASNIKQQQQQEIQNEHIFLSQRKVINNKIKNGSQNYQNNQIRQNTIIQTQQLNMYIMDQILNKVSTGIILLDNNKKFVYSNKPLKNIFKKSKIFGNITELTYFLTLKLQVIQEIKNSFHLTLEKNINKRKKKHSKTFIPNEKFLTNPKFDWFFKDKKQQRENENNNNNHIKGKYKQDQCGQVYYNQYQTSKNIQQMNRQTFLSPNCQQYRKTTTVEVFSNDPQLENSFLNDNNNNNKQQNPSLIKDSKITQSYLIIEPTNNLTIQPNRQKLINNQDRTTNCSFASSSTKNQVQQQFSKVVQSILPNNLNKLFQKENLQIDDIVNFLIKYSQSPKYQKMNTVNNLLSEYSEENISNFSYKQQKNLDQIGEIQNAISSSNEIQQNTKATDFNKKMQSDIKNDKNSSSNSSKQKQYQTEHVFKYKEGSIVSKRKNFNQTQKKKKENQKKIYDYFISNNYLHVTVQLEENDISQEEITILQIKFSVLQQIDFENQKFILIETSDITKLKKQIDNENLDIYKNKILSSVSHELRTPLNCSIQMLDMLYQNDEIPNMMKQIFVQPALNSNLLLLNIINDILDLAQINYGKFTMVFSQFELNQVCTECINLISMQALLKGVEIELDLDSNVPQVINSDSIRIRQVLLNLLSNALKFTQAGKIVIKTKLIEENLIQIDIKDSGCGISEKNINTLQRRFSQNEIFNFEQNQKKNSPNSIDIGLGLTITNNLATGLGGNRKLYVQSVENVGTKFSFWIVNHPTHKIGCKFTKKNVFNQEIILWQNILDSQKLQKQNLKNQNESLRQNSHSNKSHTLSGNQLQNQSVKSRKKNDESSSYLQSNNNNQPLQSLIKFNNDILQYQSMYHQTTSYEINQLNRHFEKDLFTNSTFNMSVIEDRKINKFQLSFKEQSQKLDDQSSVLDTNTMQNYGLERDKTIDQISNKKPNQDNYKMSLQITKNQPQENNYNIEQKLYNMTHSKQISQGSQTKQNKLNSISDLINSCTLQNLQERKNEINESEILNQNYSNIQNNLNNKTTYEFTSTKMHTEQSSLNNISNQNDYKNKKFNQSKSTVTLMKYTNQSTSDTINPQISNQLKQQIQTMQQKSKLGLIDLQIEEQYNIDNQDDSQKIQMPNQFFNQNASKKRINTLNQQNHNNNADDKISNNDIGVKIKFKDKNIDQVYQQDILQNQFHKETYFFQDSFQWINDDSIEQDSNCNKLLEEQKQSDKIDSSMDEISEIKQNQAHSKQQNQNEDQKNIKQTELNISLNEQDQIDYINQQYISLNSNPINSKNELVDKTNQQENEKQELKLNNEPPIPLQHNSQQNIKQKLLKYTSLRKCKCPNILIVDDNDFNLYALETRLKSYGFTIDRATSGFIAIEKIKKKYEDENCCKLYSLIFMDIEMPNKNGFETTLDIHSYYREKKIVQLPIISACSAYVQQTEQDKAKLCGMDYYITKPVNQLKLEQVLTSGLIDTKIKK